MAGGPSGAARTSPASRPASNPGCADHASPPWSRRPVGPLPLRQEPHKPGTAAGSLLVRTTSRTATATSPELCCSVSVAAASSSGRLPGSAVPANAVVPAQPSIPAGCKRFPSCRKGRKSRTRGSDARQLSHCQRAALSACFRNAGRSELSALGLGRVMWRRDAKSAEGTATERLTELGPLPLLGQELSPFGRTSALAISRRLAHAAQRGSRLTGAA